MAVTNAEDPAVPPNVLAEVADRTARRLAGKAALTTEPLAPDAAAIAAVRTPTQARVTGTSANTRLAYASSLNYIAAWYRLRFGADITLPVPVPAAARFILDHLPSRDDAGELVPPQLPDDIDQALVASGCKVKIGPLAAATVVQRVNMLSVAHQTADLTNPLDTPGIRELLRAGRAAAAQTQAPPRRATPIRRAELLRMLATCDDSLTGVRDRALLLFAWATGGRRRSEVADAVCANLVRIGADAYDYLLPVARKDLGDPWRADRKRLDTVVAAALTRWLVESKVTEGALFRRITDSQEAGCELTDEAVGVIVTRRAKLAKLEGRYTAHSLRAGFAMEAEIAGLPRQLGMKMTGHKTERVYRSHRDDQRPGHPSSKRDDRADK